MERLGVAVIGAGIFGQIHASTYAAMEQVDLIAVCDVNEERARKAAKACRCEAVTDLEAIAGDERIQAVSVVTPDPFHRDPCIAVARAGKHLLVEKPSATSVEDAQAIADAVAEAGVVGMVDFHNRYHPAFHSLKEKIEAGQLGLPRMLFARLSDRIEVATEWFGWAGRSGPEWFLGSHLADLACWLMDDYPQRIYADGVKEVLADRGIDCYDCVQIHLHFPRGMATLESSWIVPETWPSVADFSFSLQTTTARIDIDGSRQGSTIASGEQYRWPFLMGHTAIGEDTFGYFGLPIRHFVRTVLRGDPSPAPMSEGVRNVRIIEAAVRSIEEGQAVEMEG